MGTIIPLSVSIHLFISVFHYKYGLLNQLPLLPKVDWFTNHPLGTLILCETWIGVGWVYFLYSAVIESIPNELLELAALDNLSMFGKIRHIYLPQLKNVIFVTILFSLLNGLQEFILVLSLTGGGPNHKTEVISLFAYNRAFRLFDLGYGTAINVILLVLVIVLLLPLVMLCRKAFMRGYYHDKS
jgi:multiple sugar transport system permease protein